MATLRIDGDALVVDLSPIEQVGALCRGVRVPLSSVVSARVSDTPYAELRGMRIGTGLPWVVVLGRMWWGDGTDFVAVYGRKRRAVVVELTGERFARLVLTDQDDPVVASLNAPRST